MPHELVVALEPIELDSNDRAVVGHANQKILRNPNWVVG
jgi:hypothetical protein